MRRDLLELTRPGKTFTIQGTSGEKVGLLPRSLDVLFKCIGATKSKRETDAALPSMSANDSYKVVVSYLEVYNEFVYDLLSCNVRHKRRM